MARVRVRRGTEGPAHDPYSYLEITFWFTKRSRKPVVYHGGLGSWVRYGDCRFPVHSRHPPEEVFRRLTGLDVVTAEAIPDILLARALRRMSREEREVALMCMEADADMLANAY